MAKKKNNTASHPDDGLHLSNLIRFIINLPKKEQDHFLEMVDKIEDLPEDKREEAFFGMMLDTMSKGENIYHFLNSTIQQSEENEAEQGEDTEFSYPHFLPRLNIEKYTLRVTLNGLKPAIYRKFNVPSNITLRHLSELIIELMGWENAHLNQFCKGDKYYVPAYQSNDDYIPSFGEERKCFQEEYTLSDLLSQKGKHITFEYDFGDSWTHEVKLSSIGEYAEGEPLVSFIKGELACPPEDCGGIWGYEDLLQIRAKKQAKKRLSAEERERLEWYCLDDLNDKTLSPEYYDVDEAQEICEYYCQ